MRGFAVRYVTTPPSGLVRRSAPLNEAARRRFLLLFDMSFTDPGGLRRAQEAAADFVRSRLRGSELVEFARALVSGVRRNRPELDALLTRTAGDLALRLALEE